MLLVVLDESGIQVNATVTKKKAVLPNFLELMVKLAHNMGKFNAQLLLVTRLLKRNGSSASDLLYYLFPAYLACPDVKFS